MFVDVHITICMHDMQKKFLLVTGSCIGEAKDLIQGVLEPRVILFACDGGMCVGIVIDEFDRNDRFIYCKVPVLINPNCIDYLNNHNFSIS